MISQKSIIARSLIFTLFAGSFLVFANPSINAASKSSMTTPTPRATAAGKNSPTPTATLLPLNVVYSDTYVAQVTNITSTTESTDNEFVVSVAIDARIHRNTITSLSISLAPKTTQGAYIDPIFQAPCSKLSNLSVNSVNSLGDSTALQSRSKDGDWYLERYVLTNRSKLGTNLTPCQGQYLITSIAITDSAKHTLNIEANLASTFPVANTNTSSTPSPTRAATPQTSTTKNNDTAIMTSNIWNSRIDLAPCTAGTNLLPTLTSVNSSGRVTQVLTPAVIIPTNRVACAPIVNFDFTKPLVTILANPGGAGVNPITGIGIGNGLAIFDYAASADQNNDLDQLKNEIADLKKKNAALTSELAKYKSSKVTSKKPSTKASPTPTRRYPSGSGQNQGQPSRTKYPTPKSSPSPTRQ